MKKTFKLLPGMLLALIVAAAAKLLSMIPLSTTTVGEKVITNTIGSYIGASVIALFIGMAINHFLTGRAAEALTPGLKFTGKKVLKFAIILLGCSLSIASVLKVGGQSL